jgi:hypothetical protein
MSPPADVCYLVPLLLLQQACREIEKTAAGATEAQTIKMREGPWQSAMNELNRVRLYLDSTSEVTVEGSGAGTGDVSVQHPGF